MSNRHKVDILGDLKQQIKILQEQADCLIEELKEKGADLNGDEFIAWVEPHTSSNLSREKFEERYGRRALDGLMNSREYKTLTVRRKINKPEIYTSTQDDMQDEVPF